MLLRLCRSFTTGCVGREKGGGQAAGRGPQPPPCRAQGPHLGGAGQELLLLPGRCHRGDEAQRGQVLPFLLEKKWKVVNSTTKGHSLPHLKSCPKWLIAFWEKSRLSVPQDSAGSNLSALPSATLPCWRGSAPPTARSLRPPSPSQFPLLGTVYAAVCFAGPFMPFR